MKKYTKEELFKMDPVEVYKLVLEQKYIKRFPNGFWQQPEALDNAAKCTKYLVEDILCLSDDELKERLSQKMFCDNGLGAMLSHCFNGSAVKAIVATYPDKFKPWEFNQVPKGYWEDINHGIEATKWLIEDKLKLSDEELKEQLSTKLFKDNGLGSVLRYCFDSSPVKAIVATYPDKFKPWEFRITPQGYWEDINHGIEATKWLVEEKLRLSDEELKEQLSVKLFADNGLCGMIAVCFKNSPIEAIMATYLGKFKPWDFPQVPLGYWEDINNGIEATKWLVEEKLRLSDEELKEQFSLNIFKENNLGSMLDICFTSSPFKAINATYPNRFKPWELNQVPLNYWKDINHGIEATKWLIEDKLKLTDRELKEKLSQKIFIDNGLGGMLQHCFNSSPYGAIEAAYPGKFKKEEFKNYNKYK